jgi:cyanophycin synthetase
MSRWPFIRIGFKRLILRVVRSLRYHLGLEKTTYVDHRVEQYRRYWADAASALSAEFEPLTDSVWEVRRNGKSTRIAHYVTELDNPVTLRLAGDKEYLYRLAEAAGTPVPEHVFVDVECLDDAQRLLARTGGPLVVKPARDTSSGLGITTYVHGRRGLEWAIARASVWCPDILVESQAPGESYRLLFLVGNMIHAVRRRGTRVEADGVGTVRALAASAGVGRLDRLAMQTIQAQSLDAESVPPKGASILIRGLPESENRTRELRTVYDEDVTGLICPGIVDEIRPLIERLDTSFAGVDIVTVDPSRTLHEVGGVFLEVNTTPGIHHHDIRGEGSQPFQVGEVALAHLLSLD